MTVRKYTNYSEAVADQVVRVEFAYGEAKQVAEVLNRLRGANDPAGRFAMRFTRALERAEAKARKALGP